VSGINRKSVHGVSRVKDEPERALCIGLSNESHHTWIARDQGFYKCIERAAKRMPCSSASEGLRIKPKITLAWCEKMIPWKDKGDLNRYVDALHKAGLK